MFLLWFVLSVALDDSSNAWAIKDELLGVIAPSQFQIQIQFEFEFERQNIPVSRQTNLNSLV